MKTLLILLALISFSCKPAEERIKEHSYTQEWNYQNNQRYQVYQTKHGERYILVLNNRETKFIRKYLK
jgi:hypothetical protein